MTSVTAPVFINFNDIIPEKYFVVITSCHASTGKEENRFSRMYNTRMLLYDSFYLLLK
jgi:hypothetical protein